MGKAFFCIFLGLMCFNRNKWFSWACSVLFFISGIFYICLSVTFWKEEKAKFRNIMNSSNDKESKNDSFGLPIQNKNSKNAIEKNNNFNELNMDPILELTLKYLDIIIFILKE